MLELNAAKAAGCVVRIVHAHNTTCKHVVVHKILAPVFHFLCTHGLACGEAAGKFMFGRHPFIVVNNGVDTQKFAFHQEHRDSIRKKHNWDECKVISHVGYFSEVKNHQWIIEVFYNLTLKDKAYRLVLIGEGELRSSITEQSRKYGILDKITFTGNINNVNEYLSAADLVLMPSLFEGLPLTLIEQQANGLRCVVSDTITKEVDKTGNVTFLPLSASAEEWVNTIVQIKMVGTEERKDMSLQAIHSITACNYSIKGEAEKLKKYYLQSL